MISTTVILSELLTKLNTSETATLLVAVGSLHSFFHTVVLILMIQPYKVALFGLVCKPHPNINMNDYKISSILTSRRKKNTLSSVNPKEFNNN